MTRRRVESRGVKTYSSPPEKGIRSERALNLAVAELYVRGVSSREVAAMTETPYPIPDAERARRPRSPGSFVCSFDRQST